MHTKEFKRWMLFDRGHCACVSACAVRFTFPSLRVGREMRQPESGLKRAQRENICLSRGKGVKKKKRTCGGSVASCCVNRAHGVTHRSLPFFVSSFHFLPFSIPFPWFLFSLPFIVITSCLFTYLFLFTPTPRVSAFTSFSSVSMRAFR
ncbi:hypothetical protein, unlikely [Trypanosoma brucei gambiense DAL972]|uniref:Uncharacterized protein n=1 Tax=Trypanosoma brucei gambiense (strain MHOM/CI/86/DAL972) TaxID=679716 RepID=C9ZK96_TRYB9|nr:hypothetical protein, unlikely [Trypanosoma brucei gambiense DAL972]CBH09860.1 hypothetical protein, unlikely [Trypanosoma brucei gambiense DAL972]|eukprot:XP_011772153.1 hypothetical protein, unlikely [Trypanosoma brucei gambiense DAL972]